MSNAEAFAFGELAGLMVDAFRPRDLEGELRRILDPSAALESLHWGRSYLYRAELATASGAVAVVVKQYREESLRRRLSRRLHGPKAARSFAIARHLHSAGFPTPEPIAAVWSTAPGGPSFYLCRHLPQAVEIRALLRAARAGREREEFPGVDLPALLADVGRLARRLHELGVWHRDLSVGNLLIAPGSRGGHSLAVVDLGRARRLRRLSAFQASRDLCRLALGRREHQEALLRGYWAETHSPGKRALFLACQRAFLARQRLKEPGKRLFRALARALSPRRPHVHIPPPAREAPLRDRIVWDHLSDQPHQHAGRWGKLAVRLADSPAHLEALLAALLAAPRVVRRYRRLTRELYRSPVPWGGVGVALRPYPRDPGALLAAVEELGVRHLLLRLHPWQSDHAAEEELAGELARRGLDLAFALPQNRELVREPGRWREAVAELGRRFAPYGRSFQVGQAANRSKWGVWSYREYADLAATAGEELARIGRPLEVLGPAVIDFEPHATAAILNLRRPGLSFDAVASLLYVDRRGAPENRQLGFDTVGKVALIRAIAETSRNATGRSWITEVNWPLREGPHAPAGRGVAVDEDTQASYLVRYFVLALSTGLVERVYWWQLVARGYGLAAPGDDGGLRRRPAFNALRTLIRQLDGASSQGPLPAPPGGRLYRFVAAGGAALVVGWSAATGPVRARLPRPAAAAVGRDGEALAAPAGEEVELVAAPRYFRLEGLPQ
jgi:tRNA A-37 threonylcarbamoyl transferase component Bud32